MNGLAIVPPRERPPAMVTDFAIRLTWREFEWLKRLFRAHVGREENGQVTYDSIRMTQLLAVVHPDNDWAVHFAAEFDKTYGALNEIDPDEALPPFCRKGRRTQ
jgi:hypothetical protein